MNPFGYDQTASLVCVFCDLGRSAHLPLGGNQVGSGSVWSQEAAGVRLQILPQVLYMSAVSVYCTRPLTVCFSRECSVVVVVPLPPPLSWSRVEEAGLVEILLEEWLLRPLQTLTTLRPAAEFYRFKRKMMDSPFIRNANNNVHVFRALM